MIVRDIEGTAFKCKRIVISRYDAPSTILPFCFQISFSVSYNENGG